VIRSPDEALAYASQAGLRVTFRRLGDWGNARLLAEYEPRARTIAIDTTTCARLRDRHGPEFVARFITCAIVHETFHHRFPRAGEAAAHAFVQTSTGEDPRAFEAALRG
jgi:hypothetical protein